jgi:DNA repair photolyase
MHFAEYKTILSANNNMNIYRGCSHGCIYCDSRSKCYQMTHDFEDIEVKKDAVAILEDQLRRKRKPCMISTGSMSDPYIHLEEKLEITRQCLELIDKYGFGLAIHTKSSRILRDLDLLKRINARSKCVVQMTLTTYNEEMCRVLEPNVSTTAERYKVLKIMRDAGIQTVVWLTPTLPFINDTEENLHGILDYCIRAKVHAILCFGFSMTLREGNREYYYQKLDRWFPGLKARYVSHFGSSYVCSSPNNEGLMNIFKKLCEKNQILHDPDKVFAYLQQYETKHAQMSLF